VSGFVVGKFYKDKWGDIAVCNSVSKDLCTFACTKTGLSIRTDCNGYSTYTGKLAIVEPWDDLITIDPKVFAERLASRIASIIEEEVEKYNGGGK
jgi:hypothetical protein